MAPCREPLVICFKLSDQETVKGVRVRELLFALTVPFDSLVKRFNQACGVDASPDCFREIIKSEQIRIGFQRLRDFGVRFLPLLDKRFQSLLSVCFVSGTIQGLQVLTDCLAVRYTDPVGNVACNVNETRLVFRFWTHRMNTVLDACESMRNDEQDIRHAPCM